MKFFPCFFVFLIACGNLFCQSFDLFPEKKIYGRYYADALSHQFSISKDLESKEWFGNVGVALPLFNLGYENNLLQVSAASTVYNTVIKTPGHIQVFTVDYLVDFFFDYSLTEEIPMRFIFGHLSAHYSDDGITELNYYPISYVRDYVGLHGSYNFFCSKIYAGIYYNFHIEPELNKAFTFQTGADKFFNVYKYLKIYAAVDFKIKEEVDFIPTQSYQAGLQFIRDENSRLSLRIAYTFRNGYEERGQLYNIRDKKHAIGIFLDI